MATRMVNNRDLVEILKNSGKIIENKPWRDNPHMIVEYCGKTFRIDNPYSTRARAREVKSYEPCKESVISIKDI